MGSESTDQFLVIVYIVCFICVQPDEWKSSRRYSILICTFLAFAFEHLISLKQFLNAKVNTLNTLQLIRLCRLQTIKTNKPLIRTVIIIGDVKRKFVSIIQMISAEGGGGGGVKCRKGGFVCLTPHKFLENLHLGPEVGFECL